MADGIAAVGMEGIPNHLKDLPELNIICKIHKIHSFSETFKFSLWKSASKSWPDFIWGTSGSFCNPHTSQFHQQKSDKLMFSSFHLKYYLKSTFKRSHWPHCRQKSCVVHDSISPPVLLHQFVWSHLNFYKVRQGLSSDWSRVVKTFHLTKNEVIKKKESD